MLDTFFLSFSGAAIQARRKDDIEYSTPLWRKYFNVKQMTSVMVKEVFKSAVLSMNFEDENINDICRLWFCLLCSCFLTPTFKTLIPLKLFYYLDRLKDIPSLNWSRFIFDQIFKNMKSSCYSVRRREKNGERVGEYIHGCSFSLNILLWEHTTLFRRKSPRNRYIFQRYEGNPKKKNRTIACLSNNEVIR